MAYAFTFWTCYVLYKEYETVASMRLQFLASEKRRPDQFTVRSTPNLHIVILTHFLITSTVSYSMNHLMFILMKVEA